MKRMVTLVFLFLGVSALQAQGSFDILNHKSSPECPPGAVDCFLGTGEGGDLGFFPADDWMGEDFELATKITPTGSFSRVVFYSFLSSEEINNGDFRLKESPDLPKLDFMVNIYEADGDKPVDEPIESFTLNNVKPEMAEYYDPGDEYSNGPDVPGFICVFMLNLPQRVMLDGDGYFSVTRINNPMQIRKSQEEQEEFIFYLLGFDLGEGLEESFSRGGMILKSDDESLNNWLAPENKDLNPGDWVEESFKPVFVLDNPPIVPLGSLGLYIGMALIGGFSLIFLRRKHRSGQ